MGVKIGNTNIVNIFRGTTEIEKFFQGTTLLFENFPIETFDFDSHTISFLNVGSLFGPTGSVAHTGFAFSVNQPTAVNYFLLKAASHRTTANAPIGYIWALSAGNFHGVGVLVQAQLFSQTKNFFPPIILEPGITYQMAMRHNNENPGESAASVSSAFSFSPFINFIETRRRFDGDGTIPLELNTGSFFFSVSPSFGFEKT
jgi:hypothetical protein